jgi:hypothetical protein
MSARPSLLLKQVLKRLPRIIRPRRGRGGRFFLPRHAHFVKLAIVARILARDAHRDGLHAFEAASRIEVGALLARMQFEAALGTLPGRRHALQHRPTLRAARNSMCSRQIDRARAESIVPLRRRRRRTKRFLSRILSGLAVSVLISVLPILCHKSLPSVGVLSRQCHPQNKS